MQKYVNEFNAAVVFGLKSNPELTSFWYAALGADEYESVWNATFSGDPTKTAEAYASTLRAVMDDTQIKTHFPKLVGRRELSDKLSASGNHNLAYFCSL